MRDNQKTSTVAARFQRLIGVLLILTVLTNAVALHTLSRLRANGPASNMPKQPMDLLAEDCHKPALEFFETLQKQFMPALQSRAQAAASSLAHGCNQVTVGAAQISASSQNLSSAPAPRRNLAPGRKPRRWVAAETTSFGISSFAGPEQLPMLDERTPRTVSSIGNI